MAAAALVVLLALVRIHSRSGGAPKRAPPAGPRLLRCPVCGSPTPEGDAVRTVAYPFGGSRLVHIYGCSGCHGPAATLERRCPVCRQRLEEADYLIGRLAAGRPRGSVRVWGCSRCRPR